jgi:RNA polymerase sigma-70 factor (ECF subfamily)
MQVLLMPFDEPGSESPEDPSSVNEGPASDHSLLRRFRQGNRDAPSEIYLRYASRLLALAEKQTRGDLARRVDPEDIVQSVFRTFFRRAAQGHYDVPLGEELWKLLLVIALNKVRAAGAFHRAARRDIRATQGGEALEAAEGRGRDEQALTILRMVVDELMAELPESHRKIIEMRIEGHEVAEITDAVGRSKRSVERVLQQFRARLGQLIERGG